MVMLHGRGGSPEDMLGLAEGLGLADVAYVAPRAPARSWWPESFLAPLAANEPWLSSALAAVADAVDDLVAAGIGVERIEIMGFSQGACLALEYAARAGRRFRGVTGLSGALLGTGESGDPERGALRPRPEALRLSRHVSTGLRCSSAATATIRTSRSPGRGKRRRL
jgi:phospholipase/carboxylesterase